MLPENEKNPEDCQNSRMNPVRRAIRWFNSPGNLEKTGIAFVAVSVLLVLLIFFPVIKEEVRYAVSSRNKLAEVESQEQLAQGKKDNPKDVIVPVDEDFGVVIPKISANAKVISEVDPQNSAVYQRALTKGVAHAKGTSLPGEGGNIFIFAHSTADFFEANRYNAVFYLLSKLEAGDDVYLFYKKQKYHYKVADQKTVGADEVSYLEKGNKNQLTLMTCWPPGTTMKRLIVVAEPEK
jgi:LPXTG-site transpeptidase (sortase) family protein